MLKCLCARNLLYCIKEHQYFISTSFYDVQGCYFALSKLAHPIKTRTHHKHDHIFSRFYDTGTYGHDMTLNSFKMSIAVKFIIILDNII